MENIIICKRCGKEHDGTYGKGDFCSLHCARGYAQSCVDHKSLSSNTKGKYRVNYTCDVCGQTFLGQEAFRQHKSECTRKRKPKEEGWSCSICNESFRVRKDLLVHKKEKHGSCRAANSNFGKSAYEKFKLNCPFCGLRKETTRAGMSNHIKYCKENPNREICKGHFVSEETKLKLSNSLKKAFEEGRATGWHTRKAGTKSYPEQWFEKVIGNEFTDKDYVSELHTGKYRLDFAWPKKMRYIEIDGQQHKDPKRAESDKKKDAFCESLGWTVLRLDWSYIYNNTQEAIKIAKDFIDFGNITNPDWKSKAELLEEKRREYQKEREDKRDERRAFILAQEDIDFSKFGWGTELAKRCNISSQGLLRWIKKYMPDFYMHHRC